MFFENSLTTIEQHIELYGQYKTNEQETYKIVGEDEADIKKNLIYFRSPIGKGLIGKNKNDTVQIITPMGEKNYEIKSVKYI